jgi:hypothetical protein
MAKVAPAGVTQIKRFKKLWFKRYWIDYFAEKG